MVNLVSRAYITSGTDEFRSEQGQKNHEIAPGIIGIRGRLESSSRYTQIMAYTTKLFGLLILSITAIWAKIYDLLSLEILPTDTPGLSEVNND